MKTYAEFFAAARARESYLKYNAVNKYGFMGAYQFGMPRLADFGMARPLPGKKQSQKNSDYIWISPFSKTEFLANHPLQDRTFDRHVQSIKKQVLKSYPYLEKGDHMVGTTKVDLSGAIMASHLLGFGGLVKFMSGSDASHDANGVTASNYITHFHGFQIK